MRCWGQKQKKQKRGQCEGIQRFFFFPVVWLQKCRLNSGLFTHWISSLPLSLIASPSLTFYIETGSHEIVQAGLDLTVQPSEIELALILPVSSYKHRPPGCHWRALLDGCRGLCKWKTYQRVCIEERALERCSHPILLLFLHANCDCHITGVQ